VDASARRHLFVSLKPSRNIQKHTLTPLTYRPHRTSQATLDCLDQEAETS
jgi:hypothetical protein